MNIAIISFHGCPVARLGEKDTGGMNVYVLNLAKELGELGHTVDVFTRFHDPSDPRKVVMGPGATLIHVEAGPIGQQKADLPMYIDEFVANVSATEKSEGGSYDIIHSNYWLSGKVGAILSRRWKIPHVVTFHTLAKTKLRARVGERESDLRISVEQEVMYESTDILALTQAEKMDLENLYRICPEKVSVIPAGVDTDIFYPVPKLKARIALGLPDKETIMYAGRVEPIKGLDILLDSFKILDETRDVHLVVVGGRLSGDRELDALRRRSKELGILEKITFTGSVDQSELGCYYSAADVFVLPSHYESFGFVALEAMACGTPVVASRVGGIPSFVDNGETGYLINWRSAVPFADRIEMLLENADLRNFMSETAHGKANSMNWSIVASEVADYYCRLVKCNELATAI